MNKRIAVINPVGFEPGGATTLCVQYAKLGIDCWLKDSTIDRTLNANMYIYTNTDELIRAIDENEYERLLFLNMWYGKMPPETALNEVVKIRNAHPSLEICHINCNRTPHHLYNLQEACKKCNFMFDHIFSICKDIDKFDLCNWTYMNINAFVPFAYEPVSLKDRKNIIFTAGRIEGFKGIIKFLSSIDDDFIKSSDDFTYLHEGAKYNWNKNGTGVSCPPQLLTIFNTTVSPKVLKSQFALRSYSEEPIRNKFNIYPFYDVRDIRDRWRYYYAGICCIGGTRYGYNKVSSLFGNKFVMKDARERTQLEKQVTRWNDALEYADIEKIMFGIPMFISRQYSEIVEFNDERLIYNSFSEITDKARLLRDCYDEVRQNQYEWFVTKNKETNNNIIKEFTKEL